MNIDDIQNRLSQLELAIKKSKEFNSRPKSKTKIYPYNSDPNFQIEIRFGNKTDEEMIFDIYSIIQCLGNVKDIIKNILRAKGFNPQIIEKIIDKSIHMQVLIDIYNEYKHGYPLNKPYRSNGNPIIVEIEQGMIIPPGETIKITTFYDTGLVEVDKEISIGISAKIKDRNGKEYFSFDEMIENVISQYEIIIKEYGL